MSKKVKLISDTIKMIVFAALNAIEKFFIARIPVERVRTGMTILLSPIRQMVIALNDQDPENGEQVETLWKKFANTDLADYSENTLANLIDSIKDQMRVDSTEYEFENRKSVILMIGVNGVGKTTSVGKLAGKLKDEGKKVILAAADTFRAAAGEQLSQWADRAGVEIIGGQSGADPASVVYDAVAAAKARNADVLLCDTAGRLHNKKNLMEELRKIYRILERSIRKLILKLWLYLTEPPDRMLILRQSSLQRLPM